MKNPTIHPYRVLVADDQADIRDALRLLLKRESYETQSAASPAEALAAIESREFDAVLMDLNYARDTTSGQEGLDLLSRIQAADATLPVMVMTAWSSVEIAVEAMRRGARDFIQKPWDNARLLSILRTQIDLRNALRAGLATGSGEPLAARRIAAHVHRGGGCDAAGARCHWASRPVGRERAHHRRARNGKRSRGANSACAFAALGQTDGDGECRRACRTAFSRASCLAT